MKKLLAILLLLTLSGVSAFAVPAKQGPIVRIQPDGSTVTVYLHGDEYLHWVTDESGRMLIKDRDGFYRTSFTKAPSFPDVQRAQAMRARNSFHRSPIYEGEKRFLVILVEFSDLSFTVKSPKTAFGNMLNQAGYSDNGGTGSVKDYYMDNSSGKFTPTFDVIGPVKVSKKASYYGSNNDKGNDEHAGELFAEACSLAHAKSLVNFADYDNDKDGTIDNIFFYFAGHGEAEGGGEDTIWPHASSLAYGYGDVVYDGVHLGSYACSSELKGDKGSTMCGIGTYCHEFGHVLGLPDFYDTDYDENGSGPGLYSFSLMSHGCYNNDGRTPPHLNAEERCMLEWMKMPDFWTEGSVTLYGIQNNVAGRLPTNNKDEYYLFETRDGTSWDKYIGNAAEGLVIYHVDKSHNIVGGKTAAGLWASGYSINAFADHECFKVIPSDPVKYYQDGTYYLKYIIFPGASLVRSISDKTSPAMTAWDGGATGYGISKISISDHAVSLTVGKSGVRQVFGTVTDTDGKPIQGASVYVSDNSANSVGASHAPGVLRMSPRSKAIGKAVTTDSHGNYSVEIENSAGNSFTLHAKKEGFREGTRTFDLSVGGLRVDISLYGNIEPEFTEIKRYHSVNNLVGYGENSTTYMFAVEFTPDLLKDHVGKVFKSVNFLLGGDRATEVYAFIDFGSTRKIWKKVTAPVFNQSTSLTEFNYVDVLSEGLKVPANTSVYVGYAVKELAWGEDDYYYTYNVAIDYPGSPGAGLIDYFSTEGSSDWGEIADGQGNYYDLIISATVEQSGVEFEEYGLHYIDNPGKGELYSLGDTFYFKLVSTPAAKEPASVEWYFDGVSMNSESVSLSTSGDHTVSAVLYYGNGDTETLKCVIGVK